MVQRAVPVAQERQPVPRSQKLSCAAPVLRRRMAVRKQAAPAKAGMAVRAMLEPRVRASSDMPGSRSHRAKVGSRSQMREIRLMALLGLLARAGRGSPLRRPAGGAAEAAK